MTKAVIMAGGSGTRLWPLSRAGHPKQFLSLNGEDTMLQATINRLSLLNIDSTVIVCNEEHRFFVAEQLRAIGQEGTIILEPIARNTAPAIALAALTAKNDPLLLVLSADHVIQDEAAFSEAVTRATPLAESGKLVTFGIIPTEPHIGYGYIERGEIYGDGFSVNKFVEKPTVDVAQNYIESGNYYWNSGMFLFRASKYLEELQKYSPAIYESCAGALSKEKRDADFLRIDKLVFEQCPSSSIDYAVMEKTTDAAVIPMSAGWSDVGSWSSLWDVSAKDHEGNSIYGDTVLHNTSNSYIRTDGNLVAAIGVDNLVIVATKDALLVANKDSVENVKIVTDHLKNKSRSEWEINREVFRPWGKYDSISSGDRYQVKLITVKPGGKLSLQMHHHRAEHWIVVSGVASVTKGDDIFLLTENESTYIPLGMVHALENPGPNDLEIVEVQSGSYLGEDDIVRYDDIYGRTDK